MLRPIAVEDKYLLEPYLRMPSERTVEFGFTGLFVWAHKFNTQIEIYKDWLLLTHDGGNEPAWLFPYGPDDCVDAVDRCMALHSELFAGKPFKFTRMTERGKDILSRFYPGKFNILEADGTGDYLYRTEDLIRLTGKRYHGKRNFINRFWQTYGASAISEPICESNLPDIWAFERRWNRINGYHNSADLRDESVTIKILLDNLFELGAKGRLLRLDGHVIAFTVGAPLGADTMDIVCEKADHEIAGAYQVINNEFAKNECGEFLYVNREEDMGLPGLKKAKESYHPMQILKKFEAVRADD